MLHNFDINIIDSSIDKQFTNPCDSGNTLKRMKFSTILCNVHTNIHVSLRGCHVK